MIFLLLEQKAHEHQPHVYCHVPQLHIKRTILQK